MGKILVTGGLGFIGSHTVDKLVRDGEDVVVLDNLERQVHLSGMPVYKNRKAKYITGDIRHGNAWIKSLTGVDRIIHLAGAVGVSQSFWQSKKYLDVNASGTALLFQTLIKNPEIKRNVKKIIVASSKSILGKEFIDVSSMVNYFQVQEVSNS